MECTVRSCGKDLGERRGIGGGGEDDTVGESAGCEGRDVVGEVDIRKRVLEDVEGRGVVRRDGILVEDVAEERYEPYSRSIDSQILTGRDWH